MADNDKIVTKESLKKFYNQIQPYLNGSAHMGYTPVGTVISIMGNNAPQHYLKCDGSIYNIVDYEELANYFNEQFGSSNYFGGNGTTTFAVPDLRGEFLRGTGTTPYTDGGNGSAVGTHQAPTGINPGWTNNTTGGWSLPVAPSSTYSSIIVDNGDKYVNTGTRKSIIASTELKEKADTSSNAGYWTFRPTNTAVLYCIATKNIYIDARLNYSTSESIIGTWIDGKPIYQKTYSAITLVKNTTNLIQIGSDLDINVDLIICSNICVIGTNGWISGGSAPWTYSTISTSEKVRVEVWRSDANKLQAYGFNNDNIDYTVYITAQYTKTTD